MKKHENRVDPELAMRQKLTLGMSLEEVMEVYPGMGVLMRWGEKAMGRSFVNFGEFFEYYEGVKEYPKPMGEEEVQRFAT